MLLTLLIASFFSDTIYDKIQREHQISRGDFPDIKRMQVTTNTLKKKKKKKLIKFFF